MNRPFGLPISAPAKRIDQQLAGGLLPPGSLHGLTLSNNAGDAVNDLDIAAGVTRSAANRVNNVMSSRWRDQRDIEIPAALTKQLDVVWAPGNGGFRYTTAITDTTYHVFAIGGPGRKDDVFAYAAIDPSAVLPAGYTAYRRIASIIRSTSIVTFTQYDSEFILAAPVAYTNATPGTSAVTLALGVPAGIKVQALLNARTDGTHFMYMSSLDSTDTAPSATVSPGYSAGVVDDAITSQRIWTNTSSSIRYRASASAAVYFFLIGWVDRRGRDA